MGKWYIVVVVFVFILGAASAALAESEGEGMLVSTGAEGSYAGQPETYRLFGDMEVQGAMLSPDGKYLAFLSPADNVLNLWVGEASPDAKPRQLTSSTRAIRRYFWAWNGRQLVYKVDPAGDECYKFVAVDVETGTETGLTPEFAADGYRVATWGEGFFINNDRDPSRPDEIVVLNNELDEKRNDLWLVNLRTGKRELIQTGRQDVQRWLIDNDLKPRGFLRGEEKGATSLWLRDSAEGEFTERLRFAAGDITPYRQFQFSADNAALYLLDATGRDTMALVKLDLTSLQREVISVDDEYDASAYVFDDTRHLPLGAEYYKERLVWDALDSGYAAMLEHARQGRDEDIYVDYIPGSSKMTVYSISSVHPMTTTVLDTQNQRAYLLGTDEAVTGGDYREMQPISFTSRDGLSLHGYLTLPKDFIQPGPLVLLVHGGPDERDFWCFDEHVQKLASWGYACLQVNFRGSTGYGKSFQAAGNGEMGAGMQDDLTDAVAWAVKQGIAEPGRVAIMGESYGGYAVLMGLTRTPEIYATGIALNPICNLEAQAMHWDKLRPAWRDRSDLLMGALPRYTEGERAGEAKDPADWTEADYVLIEFLRQRSPHTKVENIRVPLIIAHGAADSRILEEHTAQFIEDCQAKGVDVTHLVFEGEGHWLAKPENYEQYYSQAEELLKRTIGGKK